MKPWKRIEPTVVHKVGYRKITTKTFIYPDGTTGTYDTVNEDGWQGVNTIALTPQNTVVVVRQFRPGPEIIMDELPGGAVESGEEDDLEQAARRELLEETGYEAGSMQYLGRQCYGAVDNAWHSYFLARDCTPHGGGQRLDESEQHEQLVALEVSIDQLLDSARQGRMTDVGAVLLAYDELIALKNQQK